MYCLLMRDEMRFVRSYNKFLGKVTKFGEDSVRIAEVIGEESI